MGKSIGWIASARRLLAGRCFWATLIALTALVLRIAHVQDSTSSPLFDAPVGNARMYAEVATDLVAGNWAGKPEPYWQPPLYSYYLAMIFWMTEQSYFLPRLIQAILGAAICVLIYFLGLIAFPDSVARGAGVGAALYGPLIYFGGELLPTIVAIFLFLLFLLFLLRSCLKSPGGCRSAIKAAGLRWLIAGFLLGLSALAAVNMLVFLPLLLLWLYACADLPRGHTRAGRALFVLLGCSLTIAPVTVRNYIVGHDRVLISANAGFDFYLGNNANYARTVQMQPGFEWQEQVESPATAEKSRYFLAKSWHFIRHEPLRYLTLSLHELYCFWHGDELRRNLDPYYARNDSTILRLLMWKYGLAFPFGLVAPLALVGMVCYWRSAPRSSSGRLLLLFLLVYMLSVVVFSATAQHRLPAVPLALLFACSGLREILVRRGNNRLRLLVAAVVLLVATNVGAGTMNMEGSGPQHFVLGTAYETLGMEANAMREYRAALEYLPDYRESVVRLGHLHTSRQEHDRAIRVYETFLRRYPETESIRFLLANAHLAAGHLKRAIAGYESLIPQRPQWAALHGTLGYAYLRDGRPSMAISAYRRTLELQPDSSLVRYQLAQLYAVQDSLRAATEQFSTLLEKDPDNAEFHTRIADLLIQRESAGENTFALPQNAATEAAEIHLQEAIRLAPNRPESHWSLGTMLARQARYDEATKHFERLSQLESDNNELFVWLANLSQRTGHNDRAQEYMARYARAERERRRQHQVQRGMDDMFKKTFGRKTMPKKNF